MRPEDWQALQHRLLPHAIAAADSAWCPYSEFPVGSALLTADGAIIRGCNVENVSYGLSNCAERSALFNAISQGLAPGSFKALLVYARGLPVISPCGACRQVMIELLDPECPVIGVGHDATATRHWTVGQLLPGAFSEF
ncbi:cytidine deaminase [Pseudomonas japonica]|uniref:cytidine deaminase n=1 Tax=Pseudomonas TaxID=286 RepID=UPI002927CE3E|nr:cytidine deaminase [Pseudomonas sp. zfem002]MDU9393074.1 cytidine deaminase [Pseudomonas sp. zfem002]